VIRAEVIRTEVIGAEVIGAEVIGTEVIGDRALNFTTILIRETKKTPIEFTQLVFFIKSIYQ